MNHSKSLAWRNQWVRSNTTSGLWSHPTGYWYFDKSQLMAYYDINTKGWKMYDRFQNQWYKYSANVFFCQNPVDKGTRQKETEEEIVYYEPYYKVVAASQLLQDKVLPLLQQGQSQLPNDDAVEKTMRAINAAFGEAGIILNQNDPKTWELSRFIGMIQSLGFLHLLQFKPSEAWREFAEMAKTAVEIFKVIAPGTAPSHAVPVFAMRQGGLLTFALALLSAMTVVFVKSMSDPDKMREYYNKYIVPMNDCFKTYAHLMLPEELKINVELSPGWKQVENCLKTKHGKTQEEVGLILAALKEAYPEGLKGLYTPITAWKLRLCTDGTWTGAKEIQANPAWTRPSCGSWVWSTDEKSSSAKVSNGFRINDVDKVITATLHFSVDNYGSVTINDHSVIHDTAIPNPSYFNPGRDVPIPREFLVKGWNTIAIEGYNYPSNTPVTSSNPAGIYAIISIVHS
ncbi:hypothetical protein [Paenibacillus kobensis]|uniref:hypothetical protein n=1 Tax=Paenibacillus kobensis TaxID=59841 RepID=UPI000FD8E566|nr:hypothetical protein [Paenibacillus kobensis]